MSADDVGGEIMHRVHALVKWPEYEEFVKEDPRRKEYVTQAGRASAKRVALKRREMDVRANSGYSRIEGRSYPALSEDNDMHELNRTLDMEWAIDVTSEEVLSVDEDYTLSSREDYTPSSPEDLKIDDASDLDSSSTIK
ncbi:hypothetical protein D1007_03148 [Hordeum vulgare]|nr:hypothetical protein D1007_03148 [Hordeum vulgare]